MEEGRKEGPQTIEKAKQDSYVARCASALQKIRAGSGQIWGALHLADGTFLTEPYEQLLRRSIDSNDPAYLRGLILTIGIVSNHGNWFTSENHNKELKVLAHSYDWLLFLSDAGLTRFIEDLLLEPVRESQPVADAFAASYVKGEAGGKKSKNRFTKVGMDLRADVVLQRYFSDNNKQRESWFNVIAPMNGSLGVLPDELDKLARKDWTRIYQ